MSEVGQMLAGRYRVLARIGAGGMAAVYRAEDLRLPGREVAIKEMNPSTLEAELAAGARARFAHEARLLARLRHPGLTTVTDFFDEAGCSYLVMDFVPGQSLAVYLQQSGRLPQVQVIEWARQLCRVLEFLHSQQPPIIFRDLKPGNIMVAPGHRLTLIDFGIARFFQPGKNGDTQNLGTPGYAAPEQYGQAQTDARSDLYSLGVVVHQMLTGYDPVQAPFYLPPPSQLVPGLSPVWDQVLAQATALNPEERYSSVAEFEAALPDLNMLSSAPTMALPAIPPTPAAPLPAATPAGRATGKAPAPGQADTVHAPVRRGRSRQFLFGLGAMTVLALLALLVLQPGGPWLRGLGARDLAANTTPTAPTATLTGKPLAGSALDSVAALISSGSQSGQIRQGGDGLLNSLGNVQSALASGDRQAARKNLLGLERDIVNGVGQGTIKIGFAQQLLLQLDSSVRSYGLYLAPWNLDTGTVDSGDN